MAADACAACLRRTDLIARIAGHLDVEWRGRRGPSRVLALPDEDLLAVADAPAVVAAYDAFDAGGARERIARAGLTALCRCAGGYPQRLLELPDPPAVLHVRGDPGVLAQEHGVAIVGSRRASAYGIRVAKAMGRGVSAAGVPVVSGLALGIDAAAHEGALAASGPVIAVLAGDAAVPYPARSRGVYEQVAARGAVVSEMPPGAAIRRWCFVARNRTIAALAAVTVVVQAAERSGSLTTADFAAEFGRGVGAVPGSVELPESVGVHALIAQGAGLVTGARDVLDLLADATGVVHGAGERGTGPAAAPPELASLLAAVQSGPPAVAALLAEPGRAFEVLAGLARLERLGHVVRDPDGGYVPAAPA